VYKPLPKTLDDLKVNIEREIRNINPDGLKSTFLNSRKRLNLIIETKGSHNEKKEKFLIEPSKNHVSRVYFKVSFIKKRSF
jgi:hypothetical protein